jgi:mannose-6-phosphate isomerase-like protein (cupin superfamily)
MQYEDIQKLSLENTYFRKVLFTNKHSQVVLMSLLPAEEIGMEVHEENDQFFRFEAGLGTVIVGETEYKVGDGDAVIVPAGTQHNVINTGTQPLKLYTLYGPPPTEETGYRGLAPREAAVGMIFEAYNYKATGQSELLDLKRRCQRCMEWERGSYCGR